jgi:uncharacterized repeat protein (TIGR04138 family)
MLCAKCHEREATVHFTQIDGDKVRKVDLCVECAGPSLRPPQSVSDVVEPASFAGMLCHGPAKEPILCQKCHEREATVHVCAVIGNETRKHDFCEECAKSETGSQKGIELGNLMEMLSSFQSPASTRDKILQSFVGKTMRYPIDAYEFVCRALDNCQEGMHVSARMLLEAIRELALKEFGKRAKAALAEWKIFRTEDFGEIVFDMIDADVLWKRPEDSKQDFQNGFNFDEAFPES